jgi:hypothetical protein
LLAERVVGGVAADGGRARLGEGPSEEVLG